MIISLYKNIIGRNDKCFCGSGLKQKKCHPDINESSIAANVIKLYKNIERDLTENIYGKVDVKCSKGCNKCCQDYFVISEVEFALIMDYLISNKGIETTNEIIGKSIEIANIFKKCNPYFYEQLEKNITGKNIYECGKIEFENMPEKQEKCVFLDECGGCIIYEVRPIICRTHGLCYYSFDLEHKVCDKIPSYIDNRENMMNIDKYEKDILNIRNYRKKGKELVIYRRQYPIFYFMKMYFGDGKSLIDYFKHPVIYNILHKTEDVLYDWICDFNGIK